MEDINALNEILNLLDFENNSNIAIPTVFYKQHILINIEYFRDSDIFKFLTNKFFEKCPQYHCSYKNEIYVYVGNIRNWLKEYYENFESKK